MKIQELEENIAVAMEDKEQKLSKRDEIIIKLLNEIALELKNLRLRL